MNRACDLLTELVHEVEKLYPDHTGIDRVGDCPVCIALTKANSYLAEPQQEDARDSARLDELQSLVKAGAYIDLGITDDDWIAVSANGDINISTTGSLRALADAALAAKDKP